MSHDGGPARKGGSPRFGAYLLTAAVWGAGWAFGVTFFGGLAFLVYILFEGIWW